MNDLQKMKLKLIEQGILTTGMDEETVETLYREKVTDNPLASSASEMKSFWPYPSVDTESDSMTPLPFEEITLNPVPPEPADEDAPETGTLTPPEPKRAPACSQSALKQTLIDILDDRLGDAKTVTIEIRDKKDNVICNVWLST